MVAALGLSALSLLLLLGVFEAGFRLAGYTPIYEVYSKPSVFWQQDPLLGWSHQPGAQGNYVGPRPFPIEYRSPVEINSMGLRGPEIEDLPPGGYRILVLGDSLVAGFEVAYEDTFTAEMEKRLSRRFDAPVQVLNAGVRGYGTDQLYLYFTERGVELEPDLVVLLHSLNDADDNVTLHRARRPFGKAAFGLAPDGSLEPRGRPIPQYPLCASVRLDAGFEPVRSDAGLGYAACWLQTRLSDHSAFFTWLVMRIQRNPDLVRRIYGIGGAPLAALRLVLAAAAHADQAPAEVAPRYRLTTALVIQLARAVRESGAEFMLVVPLRELRQMDVPALEAAGIVPRLGEIQGDALMKRAIRYRNDPHLNETGHSLLVRLLMDYVDPIVRSALAPPTLEADEEP